MSLLVTNFLMPLLLKGLAWMLLCCFAALAISSAKRLAHRKEIAVGGSAEGRGIRAGGGQSRGGGRPGSRGNLWRAALVSLIFLSGLSLLPAAWTWYLPERQVEPVKPVSVRTATVVVTVENEAPRVEPPPESAAAVPSAKEKAASWLSLWQLGGLMFLVWIGGTLGLGCWLAAGFLAVRRWIQQAAPLTADPAWRELLETESRAMGLRRPPRLLKADTLPGPCAAGVWRPVILLPENCVGWSAETRRIVLRHELAHLRARDPRQAWVRSAALVIHWLNPLVWTAIARSRRAEELAADSAVMAGPDGVAPDRYASALLEIAKSCPKRFSSRSFATTHPLLTAMAHPSTLEDRVRLILAETEALSVAAATGPPARKAAGPARFAGVGAVIPLLAAGFIGCSAVDERGGSGGMLRGTPSPVTPVTVSEMKKLTTATPATGPKFKISYRIVDAAGQLVAEDFSPGSLANGLPHSAEALTLSGDLVLKKGQRTKIEALREFPYPTEFDPPQYEPRTAAGARPKALESRFPVTPTTPRKFEFRNMGWTLSELAVRPEGASLMVSGVLRETVFEGFIRNAGEAFSPIVTDDRKVVLTDNKVLSPTFADRDTRFLTAALPGKTYRTLLNVRRPDTYLEVRCEAVAEGSR